MHAVAIEMQLLLIDRNKDLQRPFLNLAERFLVGALVALWFVGFVCRAMFVPAAVPAATVPVSGRGRRCGRGHSQACEKCNCAAAGPDAAAIPPRPVLVAPRA